METEHLITNFNSLVNTVIISPRRWGKTSLVAKVAELATQKNRKLRVCSIDLFSVRTEEEFYEMLANGVLRATYSKVEEIFNKSTQFLSHLLPKISMSSGGFEEVSIQFNWQELKKNPEAILDLAEKIAVEKKLKIVVCIDEFQNVSTFDDPVAFQKRLRSFWQRHQNVAYCLFGSKRHMLLDVFTNSEMPFYKFGDILFLEKIDTDSWIQFITERFSTTKKSILPEEAELIVALADNHPYYVQQLAQQCWLRTSRKCNCEIIHQSHQSIIDQLDLLFISKTELLSTSQINFLKAFLANEPQLSSKNTIDKYRLGTSGNITKIKKALIDKDILDDKAGILSLQDPMYAHWLKSRYFNRS